MRRSLPIATVGAAGALALTASSAMAASEREYEVTITFMKCGLNFVVPFIVSNLGLLSGRASKA